MVPTTADAIRDRLTTGGWSKAHLTHLTMSPDGPLSANNSERSSARPHLAQSDSDKTVAIR